MSDEIYVFASYDSEVDAQVAHDFLSDFHLYSDYGGKVVHMETKDWLRNKMVMRWCLVLPQSARRFSTTLEKMNSGLSDFWKGYRKAAAKFEALMVEKLKECTSDMVGEAIGDETAEGGVYWVERVTKAGKITLSPTEPKRKETFSDDYW